MVCYTPDAYKWVEQSTLKDGGGNDDGDGDDDGEGWDMRLKQR